MTLATSIFVFCVCLAVLAWVAEYVVDAVLELSRRYHVPPGIAGATLAAAATSAPELAINVFSILAARQDAGEVAGSIGLASIFGSAVFNLAVIIGVVGVIAVARLDRREVMREAIAYFVAVAGAIVFGQPDHSDGPPPRRMPPATTGGKVPGRGRLDGVTQPAPGRSRCWVFE